MKKKIKIILIGIFVIFFSLHCQDGWARRGSRMMRFFHKINFKQRAVNHYQKAQKNLKNKSYDKALTFFSDATKVYPKLSDSYFEIGKIYILKENPKKGKKFFNEYLEKIEYSLYPNKALEYLSLSGLYSGKELAPFQSQLNENQQKASYYIHQGIFLNLFQKQIEALQSFKKALKIDPDNEEAILQIGLSYYEMDQFLKAEQYLKMGIEFKNATDKTFSAYADLLKNKKDYKQAIEYYQKAYDSNKREAVYPLHIGLCYLNMQRYGLAKEQLIQVIKDFPRFSYPHYFLGILHQDHFKNTEKALKHFTQFLGLSRNKNQFTKNAQKRLEQLSA